MRQRHTSAWLAKVGIGAATVVICVVAGLALAQRLTSPRVAASGTSVPATTGTPIATCGATGLPACVTQTTWIALKSQAPGDIIAAARQSALFTVDRSGNGDYLHDVSHLGTPVFVRELTFSASVTATDFYALPIEDGTTGLTVAVATLALNPAHTMIEVQGIFTYSAPRPHDTVPSRTAAAALQALRAQRGVAARPGTAPELVCFPLDPALAQEGKPTWTAGGVYPGDPIWAITGTDGQTYVVDNTGRALPASALIPFAVAGV